MQFLHACFAEVYKTPRVRDLLLDEHSRLLQEFVPKLVILRAMLHFNSVVSAKRHALAHGETDLKELFDKVRDKRVDFGKLSAKENRFEPLPLSSFDTICITQRQFSHKHRPQG